MPSRRPVLAAAAALLAWPVTLPAAADEALVAVAANFAEVIEELQPRFAAETGHTLVATTGSTGKLYAQIVAGAPFEVLLSADAATPERLETEGAAVAGTRFTYAVGKLALWSADATLIDDKDGAAVLEGGDFRHLAIANPDLAPYGIAAQQTLESLGFWAHLQDKLVMGQNVGQTHSMVATGAAELGFVALSAVMSPRNPTEGSVWEVPQELFSPIRQDAILLQPGEGNPAAAAFLEFLTSPEAITIIEAYGYALGGDDTA
jgi:molybdate transport system substrate-binding protein